MLIDGKFSIYYPYSVQNFPSIVILQHKTWKSSSWFFHVLPILVNIMENKPKFKPNPKLKLMDQVRQVLRYHHYSYRTEQTYCDWIIRFVKFQGYKKHPNEMGKSEIEAFLGKALGS